MALFTFSYSFFSKTELSQIQYRKNFFTQKCIVNVCSGWNSIDKLCFSVYPLDIPSHIVLCFHELRLERLVQCSLAEVPYAALVNGRVVCGVDCQVIGPHPCESNPGRGSCHESIHPALHPSVQDR